MGVQERMELNELESSDFYDTFLEDPMTLQFKEEIDAATQKTIELEDRHKKQLKILEEYSDLYEGSFKYDDIEEENDYLRFLKFKSRVAQNRWSELYDQKSHYHLRQAITRELEEKREQICLL